MITIASPHGFAVFSANARYLDTIEAKILSFGRLGPGSDSDEELPAPKKVIDKALELYSLSKSVGLDADAFPVTDGGITVSFYIGEHAVRAKIRPDLTIGLVHELGIGVHYKVIEYLHNVNSERIETNLTRLVYSEKMRSWNSFALSISNATIRPADASQPIVSNQWATRSQRFQVSASMLPRPENVNTS